MEKPDFEKIAYEITEKWNYREGSDISSMMEGMEHVWNTYVVPLQDKLKESEHLKELADDAYLSLKKEVEKYIEDHNYETCQGCGFSDVVDIDGLKEFLKGK